MIPRGSEAWQAGTSATAGTIRRSATVADTDLGEYLARISKTRVNRRSFLATSGLLGSSAFLAACSSGGASAAPSGGGAAPPAGDVEKELFVYNWSDYINPDNIDAFKAEFGVENFVYDTFANNEELIAKLQGGASGYDIACPTAEYVPGMVEEGFLTKLDMSRIPNASLINETFKGLWWDPTDEYQIPKDYGTTGILYRNSLLPSVPPAGPSSSSSSRARRRARPCSSTRWVTSSSSRSRCSATP
jgi:spermidine/putrescine-binding protein